MGSEEELKHALDVMSIGDLDSDAVRSSTMQACGQREFCVYKHKKKLRDYQHLIKQQLVRSGFSFNHFPVWMQELLKERTQLYYARNYPKTHTEKFLREAIHHPRNFVPLSTRHFQDEKLSPFALAEGADEWEQPVAHGKFETNHSPTQESELLGGALTSSGGGDKHVMSRKLPLYKIYDSRNQEYEPRLEWR